MLDTNAKKKVGVLTLPLGHNYGGILQFVALQEVLSSLGCKVVLLNYQPNKPTVRSWVKNVLFSHALKNINQFLAHHIANRTRLLTNDEDILSEIRTQQLAAIIVGSDQVWQERFSGGKLETYFLTFLKEPHIKKIAYAASFGSADIITPLYTNEIAESLLSFDAVSVREDSAITFLQEVLGCTKTSHVLDPTLLLPVSFYQAIIANIDVPQSQQGLFAYILDETNATQAQIERLSEQSGLSITKMRHRPSSKIEQLIHQKSSVEQWLNEFKNAEFVVTDSYHGMIFSIQFRKPFIVLVNQRRGAARFESLAKQLGLVDRLVYSKIADISELPQIDYAKVHKKLALLKAKSFSFLCQNLVSISV